MRILLVSDLHYELRHFDWVLDHAPEFEAVVLAGDHLDVSSLVPLETQIVVVRTYLRRIAALTTTVACSGNHDLTATNVHGEQSAPWLAGDGLGATVADGRRIDLDGVRISVCPWWDGPATRADVEAQLEADAIDRPHSWIWAYHYPPDQLPVSWIGSRHIGDADLSGWISHHRPDLVLTGHIHHSPFADGGSWIARTGMTWVVNAGRAPGPFPAHVVIDLDAGRAEWATSFGRAEQLLWFDDERRTTNTGAQPTRGR